MILCVIPMKDGHVLRPEVYKSLALQTVPMAIMPITRPPLEADAGSGNQSNYLSQAFNRNLAADIISEKHFRNFTLWHCSDVVLTRVNAVELALDLMLDNEKIGAVYLNTNTTPIDISVKTMHYELSSVLVRRGVFDTVRFRSIDNRTCNCGPFNQDLKNAGWRVQFLSNEWMGHKISKYDVSEL